jgi:hypothetical protein
MNGWLSLALPFSKSCQFWVIIEVSALAFMPPFICPSDALGKQIPRFWRPLLEVAGKPTG